MFGYSGVYVGSNFCLLYFFYLFWVVRGGMRPFAWLNNESACFNIFGYVGRKVVVDRPVRLLSVSPM